MKSILSTAAIQIPLAWENPEKNRDTFSVSIEKITDDIDLIVLPEMFTTGFTMNARENAELMDGPTVKWMQNTAVKKKSAITGSLIILEEGNFYNRMIFAHPSGEIDTYDKRHLFSLAKEEHTYTAGVKKQHIHFLGWKICPMVCYDLRFPVWSRNTENYDVLLYVANWPALRTPAWDTLLKARAIENMSYCIGVNRIGKDGNGFDHHGHSVVRDSLGEALTEEHLKTEATITATLDKTHLETTRNKLKFLNDRDEFILK